MDNSVIFRGYLVDILVIFGGYLVDISVIFQHERKLEQAQVLPATLHPPVWTVTISAASHFQHAISLVVLPSQVP